MTIHRQHFYRFVTGRSNARVGILSLLFGAMLGTASCDVVRLLTKTDDGGVDMTVDKPAADSGEVEDASTEPDVGNSPFVCPKESTLRDTWKSLSASDSPWLKAWGDPMIVASGDGSLQLSFDDVVARSPMVGGYILRFQLTFSGDIIFLMQTNSISNLTAISAESDQLYVTGGSYGGREVPVGQFAGQSIGKKVARAAFFVKASQRRAAMVAVGDSQAFGSGFVQLAGMVDVPELIGANFGSKTGTVLVGAVDGCQSLSDADVERAYQEALSTSAIQ